MRKLILLLMTVGVTCVNAADLENKDKTLKPFAWAHYTAWHNPWKADYSIKNYYSYPVLPGRFTSQKAAYQAEIKAAQAQGINGFMVDVVGDTNRPTAFVSQTYQLLEAARDTSFQVAICLDRTPKDQWQIKELERMLKRFGDHPNYPKVGNKYVVATYAWKGRSPERWRTIREAMAEKGYELFLIANLDTPFKKFNPESIEKYAGTCEMIYGFGHASLCYEPEMSLIQKFNKSAKNSNAEFMATVWPGYVGAWLNGRNDYYQPFLGFDQVLNYYDAIFKLNPRWIHFTTWNDHDETSFMPLRFEFGGNAVINKYMLNRWRKQPLPKKEQVLFAYHREEMLGSVLRIEALLLPGKQSRTVTLSGRLKSLDGETVYTLAERKLTAPNSKHYAVLEWNVPTGEFAKNAIVIPEFTASGEHTKRTTDLPAVVLRTGWIENPATIKAPLDAFASQATASLQVSQSGNVLNASVSIKADVQVTRATLFRNNRPIAMMAPEKPALPQLNLMVRARKGTVGLSVVNGTIINAGRALTEPGSDEFVWDKTMLKAKNCYPWFQISAKIAAQPGLRFKCKLSAAASVDFNLDTLINEQMIRMDNGRVSVNLSPVDVNVNSFPPSKAAEVFHASIYSRSKYDNDIFYVLLETSDNRLFFSGISAPFKTLPSVGMTVLQTSVNMETSSGASGMPGRSGFLTETPPFSTPEILTTKVNPLAIQHSYWPLDYNNRNLTGERGIRVPADNFDAEEHAALRLDGKKVFKLPARLWPMGACTIAFKFRPDKAVESRQGLLRRNGWSSAFSFHMLPDNTLEVTRDDVKLTGKLQLGRWNQVRIRYDGIIAKLFIDEKEADQQKIPLSITFGNCTVLLGGGKTGKGVTGLFKELAIQSAPTQAFQNLRLPKVKPRGSQ